MRAFYRTALLVVAASGLTACFNKKEPNYQYFPNMYEAVPYETYSEVSAFPNGKEGQYPAQGSIPRGFTPYEYPNTNEGYEMAKANLKSPLDSASVDLPQGEQLYTIYCAICHGDKGDGKGTLVKREKFLGVPNYKDRQITEGSVFHVITYGLNSMGSHANQLSQEERWQVTSYVLKLRSEL
ncbi:cytochrome c [Flavobacterium coralii]|uniref:c-type cytochrome n=1 Tax=Flavobacterium coralii TaxID=2838017 RepID=UPI000C64D5FD|nr:cytochrome c [Flavobacterium coralii]MBF00886.1 cytochrome C [Flavobacterium sp.]MBY8962200.1 cytochrome c [Flavobacterium coralii]|tara:strand:- start:121 stop:666 length:546 start_codon:yes stop_codon:yes gene_type:complete